ncbi:TetR/AcrR family transcriptional regulator (plasmid) [Thioclava sp. 'Guangxiensis']|uniref:TetR/AcrR family transcriptional regulator n=1 Tax=Thioclava sp. 'Guangxiensis' TaxID=3149044 RepID=UPI0032C3EE85
MPQPPRRRGRPKAGPPEMGDGAGLRGNILDQAELAFAAQGYAGTGLREIAQRAGVDQALLRYYFGSKQDLFDAVFTRRGGVLSDRRIALLEACLAQGPTVETLVEAYLQPQWDMKHSGPNGQAFLQLQARIHAEPEAHALELRREVYDPSLKRYIAALSACLPDLPRSVLATRMAFLVGAYLFILNDLGRLSDLIEDGGARTDDSHTLRALVSFLSAGLKAPVN